MKNQIYDDARALKVPVPAGTESGDPLVLGTAKVPAMARTSRDTDGFASVYMDGAIELEVIAKNKAGNSKVSWFDAVYLMEDGTLNKNDEEGDLYGYALGEVATGATAKLTVKLATP